MKNVCQDCGIAGSVTSAKGGKMLCYSCREDSGVNLLTQKNLRIQQLELENKELRKKIHVLEQWHVIAEQHSVGAVSVRQKFRDIAREAKPLTPPEQRWDGY